jgi:hypothetical protein
VSGRAWSWARSVGWAGWARSHFFSVCWNRSALPWVWGWLGRPFFCRTPRRRSSVSRPLRPPLPPDSRVVKTIPLNVSQCRGRGAMPGHGGAEGGQHDRPGNPGVGGQVQHIPGMIIQPADDLRVAAISQSQVGEVRLPAFVRQVRLEPQVRRAGPLGRVRGDQPGPGQVPAHRRRRYPDLVVVFQVPADRVRPGV